MRAAKVVLLVSLGIIVSASALHAGGPEPVSQLGYFVTVAETSSSEEAKGFAAKVRSDGVLRASVVDSPGGARVELGPFALFIDAHIAGRVVATVPDKKMPAIEVKRVATACDSLFATRMLPQSDLRIATSQTSSMIWSANSRLGVAEAKAVMDGKVTAPETSKGLAILSVADDCRKKGDRSAALPLQLAVARGEVPADEAIRVQACWDAARSYHALAKRVEAYRAYTELEASTSNPLLALRCGRERVGLVMELAQCDKGNMADVRTLADLVLQKEMQGEERHPEIACNVELMRAESYAKENEWAAAERELGAFIERWNKHGRTFIRELATAMNWRGKALLNLKQVDLAIRSFEDVIKLGMKSESNFAGHNQDAIAAYFLVCAYRDKGDLEGMKAWTKFLAEKHPGWSEGKAAEEVVEKFVAERANR